MKKILILISIFMSYMSLSQNTRLLRQPTLSKTDIVFVYGADLWKVPVNGGNAIRLTSDTGNESDPHFSKDGQWIAFTAEYDGNTDVFLVSINGGEPKRLTYHPSKDYVQGWTPDGKILFRSDRESRPTETNKFYTISTKGARQKLLKFQELLMGKFLMTINTLLTHQSQVGMLNGEITEVDKQCQFGL
ncbi:hypothetical protein [Polaribacter filamentus]|uniref:hypothetical protein n=1 Tax=Polaribacter filamentus TaxID=53483 RepID=UPI001F0C07C2|nr:hypothetical protein [Polaribacter filamentus]